MALEGNFDYARARLHARHGRRARPADWSHLDASRDLQHFLTTSAASPLGEWTRRLTPDMDGRSIERELRGAWREYVTEIATWLPTKWRPATRWVRHLPDLEYVARLAHPEPPPSFMYADPIFAPLAPGSPVERAAAMQTTSLAPLAGAVLTGSSVPAAWLEHWQRILPRLGDQDCKWLGALEDAVREYLKPAPEGRRERLEARASRVFRLASDSPVTALAHLALVALDLEKLRGRVVVRALMRGRKP